MADSKPIAGRVHPDVHKSLKEEAERRGTTLGSLVEEILRGWHTSHLQQAQIDDESYEPGAIPVASVEDREARGGDSVIVVEAVSKERADDVRSELAQFVHRTDDKRFTEVILDREAKTHVREVESLSA